MLEPEQCIELFGIMKRLRGITIPSGKLGVNKLSELAHDSSIISLYQFMGEELEITLDQFLEGYATLLERMNNEDGVLTDKDAVVGYVRINGAPMTLSWEGWRLYVAAPDDPDVGWPPGTIVLSRAFQPIPILHLQPSLAL